VLQFEAAVQLQAESSNFALSSNIWWTL